MLSFLIHEIFTFYIKSMLKFNCPNSSPKVNNVKLFLCIIYLHFVLNLHCVSLYIFHSVEISVIEHVISMATISKTHINCKQISIKRKLDFINNVNATSGMLRNICR